MTGTTPQCAYIGGHADGYDPQCHWCWDNAAWDYAGRVADAHVARLKREDDQRLARVMGTLFVALVVIAVIWMACS